MVEPVHIFDRKLLALRKKRKHTSDADFLKNWSQGQLDDRLKDINRDFKTALHLDDDKTIGKSPVTFDEEFLPVANQSLDLITCNLNLHTINDLPGALIQFRRALKPDGLFIASMFGGETLHELRQSLTHAEMELKGGVSPRVFPFADKQDMGALMQRAGFALPVVDSDILTVTYADMFKLINDLRAMGESNIIAARDKRYVGKEFFFKAAQHYQENFSDPDGRIRASFEIIFLIGWAPHDSQQKPLKPGSAQNRLADALETKEIGAGEKVS